MCVPVFLYSPSLTLPQMGRERLTEERPHPCPSPEKGGERLTGGKSLTTFPSPEKEGERL